MLTSVQISSTHYIDIFNMIIVISLHSVDNSYLLQLSCVKLVMLPFKEILIPLTEINICEENMWWCHDFVETRLSQHMRCIWNSFINYFSGLTKIWQNKLKEINNPISQYFSLKDLFFCTVVHWKSIWCSVSEASMKMSYLKLWG